MMSDTYREAAYAQVDRVIAEWDEELRAIEREARETGEWHATKLYYDCTPDHSLSADDEGDLVALCVRCADKHYRDVQHASDDADGMRCEVCDDA